MTDKKISKILWGLTTLTAVVSGFFIYFCLTRFVFIGERHVLWAETGQVGDFVGGVVGTLVSALGFVLVYVSLERQTKTDNKQDVQYQKSQIESRFIELVKLHKENLYDIQVKKGRNEIVEDRKAIDFIVNQINDCFREISPFFNDVNGVDIYTTEYYATTSNLVLRRKNLTLVGLAQIDIAYSIVFFGTSQEDLQSLGKLFDQYYKAEFIRKIILFIRLKPLKDRLQEWDLIIKSNLSKEKICEIIEKFNQNQQLTTLKDDEPKYMHSFQTLLTNNKFQKYYGGHQYKLGHYFRHLFQTVKYINEKEILNYHEKYSYIKILRAQLSTIEQYLIFYNSMSFMGRAWEAKFVDSDSMEGINSWFITKYNFIKNVPDFCLLEDVNIRDCYPEINFEFTKRPAQREMLEKCFK